MTTRYAKVSDALVETLLGKPRFTSGEAAREADVSLDDARSLWRALGFPDVPSDVRAFSDRDVTMLRASREILDRQDADEEVLRQIARASGQALARMTAVQVVPIANVILHSMSSRDATDSEAVEEIVGAGDALLTRVEPFVGYAWRRHVVATMLQLAASGAEDRAHEQNLVVGFADIVGFTAASQELGNREIAHTIGRFEKLAYDVIANRGGRVVKMIGDEVMFTTDDPVLAADVALSLVESCESDDVLPELRIGLASGSALLWEGDVYGPTVNLASRLVNIAHRSSVLVSEELAEQLDEHSDYDLRRTPRVKLKGIGRTRPRVLRRG